MASELKSYVEKFLLNPAASFNVDEEGNEETSAQIIESVAADECAEHQQSRSKLRARNEALLLGADSRYRGKNVTRKDLKENITFDPSLTKYFAAGTDEEDSDSEDEETYHKENSRLSNLDSGGSTDGEKEETHNSRLEDSKLTSDVEKSNSEKSENEDSSENESLEEETYGDSPREIDMDEDKEEDGFIYDGDFNKFAEDVEEMSDEDSGTDEDNDGDDKDVQKRKKVSENNSGITIKKFQNVDEEEELKKSQCVKTQLAVFDSLFELRIGMQKGLNGANQLPQFNTYKSFLQEKDPNYMKNLASAKSTTKKLLNILLESQMMLANQNPETKYLMSDSKKQSSMDSDEEVTSSEDEIKTRENSVKRGTKRKLKVAEYSNILNKRHAALLPFRDETLTRWYEKTKLLLSARGRDKFGGFEVSALQQLKNILNNKAQLIKRTQLTGVTRGSTYHILGTNDESIAEAEREQYDPEIFDDNDFYSRALEDMLKSKISLSDNMSDVSRKWIEIQKLRKKAKRKVDTKATKGRKLKYEVISKLQQYLAPCCPPQMDDAAINSLFSSLFGKGIPHDRNGAI
ncbi:protein AATF-like [Palaemon carinicauda]|uniref:protein AATF-like n=1 Tax=Palaemon carinicauda TaxID=392227 RepID=UPI0035B696EB